MLILRKFKLTMKVSSLDNDTKGDSITPSSPDVLSQSAVEKPQYANILLAAAFRQRSGRSLRG